MMNSVLEPIKKGLEPEDMHISKVNSTPCHWKSLELLCKAVNIGVLILKEIGHCHIALLIYGIYLCLQEATLVKA